MHMKFQVLLLSVLLFDVPQIAKECVQECNASIDVFERLQTRSAQVLHDGCIPSSMIRCTQIKQPWASQCACLLQATNSHFHSAPATLAVITSVA